MTNPLDHIPDSGKHALDALAAFAAIGTLAKILPPLAAFLSIIWLSLQIFGWVENRIKNRA
jgi:hypothetical protein